MKNAFYLSMIGIILPMFIHAQWIPQATAFKERRGLWDISIANENTVWALAYRASGGIYASVPEITKTVNGGNTWTVGAFPSGFQWGSISAISDQIAWVIATNYNVGGAAIFKTSDGGNIWKQQGRDEIYDLNSSANFVHFWDANIGVAFGDPNSGEFEIYTTVDGGDHWTIVPPDAIPDPLPNEYGNWRYCTVGNDIWIATNQYRIFHSADKGLTWSLIETGIPLVESIQWIDVVFWNQNEGLARLMEWRTGDNILVLRTDDGGKTWNEVNYTGTLFGSSLCGITYVPGTTSTLISTSIQRNTPIGSSYSNDGGTTWTIIDTAVGHYISRFINPTTGWSGGFNDSETETGIFKFTGNLVNVKNSQTGKEISFGAYPNPCKDYLMVQLNNGENADLKLSIFDLNGRVVYQNTYGEPGEFFMRSLDLSALTKGEYILRIENGPLDHSVQIIIQ